MDEAIKELIEEVCMDSLKQFNSERNVQSDLFLEIKIKIENLDFLNDEIKWEIGMNLSSERSLNDISKLQCLLKRKNECYEEIKTLIKEAKKSIDNQIFEALHFKRANEKDATIGGRNFKDLEEEIKQSTIILNERENWAFSVFYNLENYFKELKS